ncbi:unnamed protein product [Thlaspi arvense]|uniref:MATH domain-containing protein n=1 Tax=Thlaspi arvense TaxID=13288 RepID=A0AAU9SN57_THLAR|nr:unnamed protein product [Thlaspi arvense]
MMSHYRNTISVVYLLFCLSITSASVSSVIRQFTDDSNTSLQQEVGAGPIPNLDEPNYLDNYHGVSSRDHKVSASNTTKGLRTRAPSSYSVKMDSYTTLLESNVGGYYRTRPFWADGYNWTMRVYPNGYYRENGTGYLSLYVETHYTTTIPSGEEVYADVRFYIFNKNENQYFTIQGTDLLRIRSFGLPRGFSQVIPVNTFKDSTNGYLYDGDHCEFGVDVTVPSLFEKSELFTVTKDFSNPTFTWAISGYSHLVEEYYHSDRFTMANREFYVRVYPNGGFGEEGKSLSVFLFLVGPRSEPYDGVLVKAKIRVLNQHPSNNIQVNLDGWYAQGVAYGSHNLVPLAYLRDSSKGFVVNDVLRVQIEMDAISATEYFPN